MEDLVQKNVALMVIKGEGGGWTEEEVVKFMEESIDESDWIQREVKVKQHFNGFPPFWFSAIIYPGDVLVKVRKRWSKSSK
ncbi:MAG: hypothetical protein Q8O88_05100 [bacterium]|nr:hypothetical protein [bacterium]